MFLFEFFCTSLFISGLSVQIFQNVPYETSKKDYPLYPALFFSKIKENKMFVIRFIVR
ncbi:hypothetical protein BRYFOR_09590 [Marvinbryantia formatexigens DSM 14469]|uniref:Uncharacterized protein n=1 Tax=Marvinbryantia formatexigens DSM 14469 TaxID=478749 RepID=C6LLP2_9FIRM|nr:hypothetical protein BRYFOR_09590 [Marvinbryantia formatexigens DSM 14469]